MDPNSYLKSGTNELKILEFSSANLFFGLNMLKTSRVVGVPEKLRGRGRKTHPSVLGIMEDHGRIVPVIDLSIFLELRKPGHSKGPLSGRILITEFFGQINGFLIDRVHYVHTILWERVFDATEIMGEFGSRYVIGIVRPNDEKNILLLDYEKIILELSPALKHFEETQASAHDLAGKERKILIAEDSPAVRDMLAYELGERGFKIVLAKDGVDALQKVEENQDLALLISDIEMPQLEGLSLTKQVKERFPKLPVIVYSSIGDVGMKKRADDVNADAHVTKLNLQELLDAADRLLQTH
ncbi:MAG: chemotaxis protein CheV [Candidatus Riflebacteria bacterium]|nr:chemotaxis protein CheV [Candidatus Riflebacteria bacterium]